MTIHDSVGAFSRRKLAAGVAWALPAVAAGAAAPARAASIPPGLQGWVTVSKSCGSGGNVFEIDGRGSYPDHGLWVFNTTATTSITSAKITLYYPTSLGVIGWGAAAGNSGWSTPLSDPSAPTIAGKRAYSMTYSGTWTYVASGSPAPYAYATGQPHFSASVSFDRCRPDLELYARRSVVVDGSTIEFLRGPVTLGDDD